VKRYKRFQWIGTILVLSLLVGYFIYTHWVEVTPFYAVKYDPEIQYFSNSLALFKGASYAYIDHPGTPLEVVGSFLLATTRPITRARGELFIPFHLANPHFFTTMAHALVAILSLATVGLLIHRSWEIDGWASLIASLGLGVTYFAAYAPLTFRTLDWWTHNAFNLPFGTLLLLGVVLRLRRSESLGNLELVSFGILAGLLLCVQLYFIAWAIGILTSIILFEILSERSILAAVRSSVLSVSGLLLGFFIGFAPVMHRFRSFYLWVRRLIFHQGRYGQGPEGITTTGQFLDNLRWLWNRGELVFFLSLVALILLLIAMVRRRSQQDRAPGWWAVSIGVLLQFVTLWILIGKHPGINYLISVAALLPVVFLLALQPIVDRDGVRKLILLTFGGILIVMFLVGLIVAVQDNHAWSKQVQTADEEIDRAIADYASDNGLSRDDLVILWGYGVPSRCYALRYGNGSTENRALRAEIDELCPNEWNYDVWGGFVELPWVYEPLSDNCDWDMLILPERYLPELDSARAKVYQLSAQTRGYGKITIVEMIQGACPSAAAEN
jgi:hypothetical protein